MRMKRQKGEKAHLREKLVDDRVSDTSAVVRRTTLFANGVELVEDDDMKAGLVSLLLVLLVEKR
jgi:hypothetical protein